MRNTNYALVWKMAERFVELSLARRRNKSDEGLTLETSAS